jgi:hypothetical protein
MTKTICSIAGLAAMLLFADASMAAKEVHPSCGPPGTWCKLGNVTASRDRDHDTIEIRGSDDEFRALKFKVKNSPINIHRMVVTYDNGAREEINTRNDIPKGGESRNIDLRGSGKRSLRKVEFWYDSAGLLNGKAEVRLLGLR